MMAADAGAAVLETNDDSPKIPDKKKTKFDVIIIGAGPSGYTAGIYCSRAGYDTLILSGILPGGQLVNTTEVENYPGFENGPEAWCLASSSNYPGFKNGPGAW